MAKTIYVNCPFCKGMMEIDTESGELINKWSHEERSQGAEDKMSSALKKIEQDKKKRATLFDKTKGELEGQKKKLEESFREQVERAKKEGTPEKPFRPFDLD
jgi:uncharacterized protein YpuA (DUF1002 family)